MIYKKKCKYNQFLLFYLKQIFFVCVIFLYSSSLFKLLYLNYDIVEV